METESNGTDILFSRLCEAGKTMTYALQTLMLGQIDVLDVDISIDSEARLVKCIAHVVKQEIVMAFSYQADEDPNKPTEYAIAFLMETTHGAELVDVVHYPENDYHIMSYDMTFPPPSQFIETTKRMVSHILVSPDL
jgi:hypothetical protein